MTKNQQREQGKLMMDAADHPEWWFDSSYDNGTTWQPVNVGEPQWNFYGNAIYRRHPEPRLRPWTPEEARGKWVMRKQGGEQWLISGVGSESVYFSGTWTGLRNLLANYVQLDGSPAGEVEQ